MGKLKYSKPAYELVLELLKKEGKPLTTREIAEKTGINYNTVRGRLQDLKRKGLVTYALNGWFYSK